jgi:hypothetical protein
LYADGGIRRISLEVEKAAGRIPAEKQAITVGPGADIPELRKLSLD